MPALVCPQCRALLAPESLQSQNSTPCPACHVPLQAWIFPALYRSGSPSPTAESLIDTSEASCFYHPSKKAVIPCHRCGRFLCALCDLPIGDEHICPHCLEIGSAKGKLPTLERQRVLYDSIALALVVYPTVLFVVMWLFFPITAAAALVVTIRYWKAPRSLVRPGHGRFITAITGAVVHLIAWAVVAIIYFAAR